MRARDNPFSSDRVLRVRFKPLGTTWDAIFARLGELDYRAAIVGPDGTGKTTLLEDLARPLNDRGFNTRWVTLNLAKRKPTRDDARHAFHDLTKRDILLVDGADHMPPREWRSFASRAAKAGGLIITSHVEGLLPPLLHTQTTPDLLAEIVGHLAFGHLVPPPAMFADLHHRHAGNLRDALRELYDRCADMADEAHPGVRK